MDGRLRICEMNARGHTKPPSGVALSKGRVVVKPTVKVQPRIQRPQLHKFILVNDDFAPREFAVMVLTVEFRMNGQQAYRMTITAHRRGVYDGAVFAKEIVEAKATRATEAGRSKGYPQLFMTEPEE